MASYYILALRDIRADVYSMPELWPRVNLAIRAFEDRCRSKNEQDLVARHPADFELMLIGEFEDNTGTFLIYEGADRKQVAIGGLNAERTQGTRELRMPNTN